MPVPIFNVFQPGLRRGSEHLPYDPSKAYAYVEHPIEGWRVYLRSCVFLYKIGSKDPKHFLVVKKTGARPSSASWEPPKGQMESKEMRRNPHSTIVGLLAENVRRETEEEAHVTTINHLRYTGLVFQSQETDFPPNTYFQYHIFQGFISQEQIDQSIGMFQWIKEHPKAFAKFTRDRKEKDAISWYNPRITKLNPRWCPGILVLYLINTKSL